MALSNWDTLAFDHQGQPCDGSLDGFDGSSVQIYKNWINISDPKMWADNRCFVRPVIAQLNDGDLHVSEFAISATRHALQSSVFVLATCRRYGNSPESRCLAGIGCSGYTDPSALIYAAAGVSPEAWDDCFYGRGPSGIEINLMKNGQYHQQHLPDEPRFESQWVGVMPETLDAFFTWLETEIDLKDDEPPNAAWLQTCRDQGGLRFNQGDAYFARMGIDHLDSTRVGESSEPIIKRMMEDIKKGASMRPFRDYRAR